MRAFFFAYNGSHMKRFLIALALPAVLAGCAKGQDEQLAYDACLAAGKKDAKYAQAAFATREKSNIQASAGDSGIRVNIPYELGGKKELYQCIADKQPDGSYKVTF
jgi:hypothetical protein